jgi:hypothetical protein
MPLDPCIRSQLKQNIYIASPSGLSASGDKTYGTATCVKARVERRTNVIETADGQFKETTHRILTESAIDLKDRIWLPGEDQTDSSAARLPQRVDIGVDENGLTTHYEVQV